MPYKSETRQAAYNRAYCARKKSEGKRKTRTAAAVKRQYNGKTYAFYSIALRWDKDGDIIAQIENLRAAGFTTAEILRYFFTGRTQC